MTKPSPAEEVKSKISSLQFDLKNLQTAVRLSTIRDSVEDLQSSVLGIDRRIQSLREQGYAFEKDLETLAADFAHQWQRIAPDIKAEIDREAGGLQRSLRPLELQISQLKGDSSPPAAVRDQLAALETRLEALESRVDAAEGSIRGMYDQFSSDFYQASAHLSDLEWMLRELSEATFELLASESGIMAVKAIWAQDGEETKNDPEGVLYLTDQRLIFEQKEKVATKKVLFIATEKELIQETRWEVPVSQIEEVSSQRKGFLKKDQFIEVKFRSGSPLGSALLHIWQPGDEWVSLINRARGGEFDATRAVPIDEDILQKVANAPTQCESCGGVINQPILRGMDAITCEYCGTVMRL